jgi:hypothetical protein
LYDLQTLEQEIPNERISGLGCIACRIAGYYDTPAQIHHLRCDGSMGKKGARRIPLCPRHHTDGGHGIAFHAGPRTFEHNWGTEEFLWKKAMSLLQTSASK